MAHGCPVDIKFGNYEPRREAEASKWQRVSSIIEIKVLCETENERGIRNGTHYTNLKGYTV